MILHPPHVFLKAVLPFERMLSGISLVFDFFFVLNNCNQFCELPRSWQTGARLNLPKVICLPTYALGRRRHLTSSPTKRLAYRPHSRFIAVALFFLETSPTRQSSLSSTSSQQLGQRVGSINVLPVVTNNMPLIDDGFEALLEPFYNGKKLTDPISTKEDKFQLLPAFLKVKGTFPRFALTFLSFIVTQLFSNLPLQVSSNST